MPSIVKAGESSGARRRVYFDLRDATDGITPETGESGGQPEINPNDAGWTAVGIGTLVHLGHGRYYAELDAGTVATVGTRVLARYKSAATAETPSREDILVADYAPQSLVAAIGDALAAEHGPGSWQQAIIAAGTAAGTAVVPVQTPLNARSSEDFDVDFFIDGLDTTAVGGVFVFTLKRSLDDSDGDAIIQLILGSEEDSGVATYKGSPVFDTDIRFGGEKVKTDGGGTLPAATTVSLHLASTIMDIPPSPDGAPYVYQLDYWPEPTAKKPLAQETFTVARTVTRRAVRPGYTPH